MSFPSSSLQDGGALQDQRAGQAVDLRRQREEGEGSLWLGRLPVESTFEATRFYREALPEND